MPVITLGDAGVEKVFDLLLGISPSASRYLALLALPPEAGDTGSTITESDYPAYSRISYSSANWTDTTVGGLRLNEVSATFPSVDSGAATALGVALLSASSGGDLLAYCVFDETDWITFDEGQTPRFPPNALAMAIAALETE